LRVAINGGGGHGSVVVDIIEKLPQFTLVGILDSRLKLGQRILGYEVLGLPESIQAQIQNHNIQVGQCGARIGSGHPISRGDSSHRANRHKCHDRAGDFVSFASKSCTGGGATIGNFSAICLGTNVIDRITIGEHTVIDAGSTVLHDQPSCSIAYGTPVRITNDRQPGDRYL